MTSSISNVLEKFVDDVYACQQYRFEHDKSHGNYWTGKTWAHKSLMRCFCSWLVHNGVGLPSNLDELMSWMEEVWASEHHRLDLQSFKERSLAAGTYYTEGVDDDEHFEEDGQKELEIAPLVEERLENGEEPSDEDDSGIQGGAEVDSDAEQNEHGGVADDGTIFGGELDGTHDTKEKQRLQASHQRKSKHVEDSEESGKDAESDNNSEDKQPTTKRSRGPYTKAPAIADAIIDRVAHSDYIHEQIISSTDALGNVRSRDELIAAIGRLNKNSNGRRKLRLWANSKGFF